MTITYDSKWQALFLDYSNFSLTHLILAHLSKIGICGNTNLSQGCFSSMKMTKKKYNWLHFVTVFMEWGHYTEIIK